MKLLLIVSILVGIAIHLGDQGGYNLYTHQAKAFLHGNINIPDKLFDMAVFEDKFYVVFPPFPAVLLIPFVALFGINIKVIFVALLLTALNVYILKRILIKLDIPPPILNWSLLAFFLGTAYWSCVSYSGWVYYFAHIVAVTCILLALNESFYRGRGYLIGLFLGLAFMSRQMSIYYMIFFMTLIYFNEDDKIRSKNNMWQLLSVFGVFVLGYMVYNGIRFHSIMDTGYSYIPLDPPVTPFLKERVAQYGLFNIAYIPFNFIQMFIEGFHINFTSITYLKILSVSPFGTSLTAASPFIFYAFKANWKRNIIIAAWITIAMIIIHQLMYYNNGYVQTHGCRFSLDFMPLLILLAALGFKNVKDTVWKILISYSIVLNIIALVVIDRLGSYRCVEGQNMVQVFTIN